MKPANSKNDIFKNPKCPLKKKSYTAETENWKRPFLKGTRGWMTSLKKTNVPLLKKMHFLAAGGQTPPPSGKFH